MDHIRERLYFSSLPVRRLLQNTPFWGLIKRALSWTLPHSATVHQKCGVSFHVDLRAREWRYVVSRGYQEPDTEFFFSRYLSDGYVVVDVGANIGTLSIIAAVKVGKEGQVHAFEPHPHNADLIRSGRALNGLDNLVVNQVAASERSGKLQMIRPAENPTYIRFVADSPAFGSDRSVLGGREEVDMVSLDEYFEALHIRRCDLIKVDVDGPELAVLKGAQKVIRRYKPVLVVEVGPYNLAYDYSYKDVVCLLKGEGYTVCAFSRVDPTPKGMRYIENLEESTIAGEANLYAWSADMDTDRFRRLGHPSTWLQQFSSW